MKRFIALLALILIVSGLQAQTQMTVLTTRTYGIPNVLAAYTAGDVVGDSGRYATPIEFQNAVRYAGGSGQILSATLVMDSINVTTGTFRLHLFRDSTDYTKAATNTLDTLDDHAAYVIKVTCRGIYVGYIDFTLLAGPTGSTMSYAQNTAPAIYFTTLRYRSLWGVLTATGAYTRKQTGAFTITLRIRED